MKIWNHAVPPQRKIISHYPGKSRYTISGTMTKTTQGIAVYLFLFSIIISSCGPGQVLGPTITPIPTSRTTPEPTATPVFGIGSTMTREKDGMVMVYVPAGPFQKGDDNNQAISHTESLDAFWIDQTEVTNAMFQAFVQVTKYKTDAEKIGKGMLVIPDLMKYETIPGVNWMHPQGPISNLLGMWMRNNWGLWNQEARLTLYFDILGIQDADDVSSFILVSYWESLNGKPINIPRRIVYNKIGRDEIESGPKPSN